MWYSADLYYIKVRTKWQEVSIVTIAKQRKKTPKKGTAELAPGKETMNGELVQEELKSIAPESAHVEMSLLLTIQHIAPLVPLKREKTI